MSAECTTVLCSFDGPDSIRLSSEKFFLILHRLLLTTFVASLSTSFTL